MLQPAIIDHAAYRPGGHDKALRGLVDGQELGFRRSRKSGTGRCRVRLGRLAFDRRPGLRRPIGQRSAIRSCWMLSELRLAVLIGAARHSRSIANPRPRRVRITSRLSREVLRLAEWVLSDREGLVRMTACHCGHDRSQPQQR